MAGMKRRPSCTRGMQNRFVGTKNLFLLKLRYLSVGNSGQQEMAEEEDELLTSVLINLATFMSVTGMCEDKCRQLVTNLVMYCRLGHRCDTIVSTLKVHIHHCFSPTMSEIFRRE